MTWPHACALCLVRYSENHQDSNRVDSASINTLVSKNNPCMFIKVEIFYLPSLDVSRRSWPLLLKWDPLSIASKREKTIWILLQCVKLTTLQTMQREDGYKTRASGILNSRVLRQTVKSFGLTWCFTGQPYGFLIPSNFEFVRKILSRDRPLAAVISLKWHCNRCQLYQVKRMPEMVLTQCDFCPVLWMSKWWNSNKRG